MEQGDSLPISGVESVQGRRVTMEDTHVNIDEVKKQFPTISYSPCAYYGVHDGHGGKDAAVVCADVLHKAILSDETFGTSIETALKNGFAKTDKRILEQSLTEGWKSGTTVVVSILAQDHIYIANCGDSEAVVGKRKDGGAYEPLLISKKHKPNDASEKERIKNAGGHVVFGRVMGVLAVARALGDRDQKSPYNKAEADFVSAEPYIAKIPIESDFDFLIVSCDGLWDKLSYETAVEFVGERKSEGKSPTEAAQLLVQDALEKGSMDNVTAIVVYLSKNNLIKSPSTPTSEGKHEKKTKKERKPSRASDNALKSPESRKNSEADNHHHSEDGNHAQEHDLLKWREKLNDFGLPSDEELLAEYQCMLERKIPYQGSLLVTSNHLCFVSSFPSKKNKSDIPINDIQCIEKTKSLITMSAIKITTKSGKKHIFNWKQNNHLRDQAFTKLLELVDAQTVHSHEHEEEEHKHEEKQQKNEQKTDQKNEQKQIEQKPVEQQQKAEKPAFQNFSRFDD